MKNEYADALKKISGCAPPGFLTDTLALIEKQKAEIERLKSENEKLKEKQIPQQIRIIHSGKTCCPVCGMLLKNYKSISEKPLYCKHCGQALNWDVEYKEITLEKALELLRSEYEWAEHQKLIGDPLTHALNKVWNAVTEAKR